MNSISCRPRALPPRSSCSACHLEMVSPVIPDTYARASRRCAGENKKEQCFKATEHEITQFTMRSHMTIQHRWFKVCNMRSVLCFPMAPLLPSASSRKSQVPHRQLCPISSCFYWFLRSYPISSHWKPLTFACINTHTHIAPCQLAHCTLKPISRLESKKRRRPVSGLVPRSEPPCSLIASLPPRKQPYLPAALFTLLPQYSFKKKKQKKKRLLQCGHIAETLHRTWLGLDMYSTRMHV